MTRDRFINFVVALFFMPLAGTAEPSGTDFGCSLVRGVTDVRIDGSLAEWNSRVVAHPLRWSESVSAASPESATANARCLADDLFLYLAISVSANSLRFETLPFNQAWRNDSVEVFFSSSSGGLSAHLRAGLIRVSLDSEGRIVTEGSASVTDGVRTTRSFAYPLFWQAIGVKAGFQLASTGYTVEVAIPRSSIAWTQPLALAGLSMNVRVRRSCAGKPCQSVLELSDDPYDSSPVSNERYRHLSFQRQPRAVTGVVPRGQEDDGSVAFLLYRALLRMHALDPRTAAVILSESQDTRLLPVMASALIAAGRLDSAVRVLGSISPAEFGDAVRFWAIEQMPHSQLLQGATSAAKSEYETLADSGRPAFKDIGVAGLIDLHLADGRVDAAIAAYKEAFDGDNSSGMRSASRIAGALQNTGRVQEAIDVLTRVSESNTAHDSERAWALLQLQSLYQQSGNSENAVATGWRLQVLAPPGSPYGEVGLKKLIGMATFGRITPSPAPAFSDSYRKFLEANPGATDPARQIAYASELRWEGKLDEAAALYQEVARAPNARRRDRTAALLSLQRLQLDSGHVELSLETGLAVEDVIPQDVGSRLASWHLMRAASAASGTPLSLLKRVADFGRSLARDIRLAQDTTNAPQGRTQTLLLQLEKEFSLQ